MLLILLSFLAGILTVLAPCVFPLLPLIIGGVSSSTKKYSAVVIIGSLIFSIATFSILLRATTALIDIDPSFWNYLSGSLIILLGLSYVFPEYWTIISSKLKLSSQSDKLLEKASSKDSYFNNFLTGVALGPVFTSCSPTYAYILAVVLPLNWALGLINLFSYILGLALILGTIALLGRRLVKTLRWAADPNGLFKQILGGVFLLLGLAIMFGWIKDLEALSLNLLGGNILNWENSILSNILK